MTNQVAVSRLEGKSHNSPDETRTPAKTKVEVVNLEGFTIGRFNFEPGWRWSECIKPVAGTDNCQLSHVGHVLSGTITIRLEDGSEQTMRAGDSYTIPPGHDAWVVGDEPVVALEVMSAAQFAKA
jgi:quercetin dioxygenase-like cupin family protein